MSADRRVPVTTLPALSDPLLVERTRWPRPCTSRRPLLDYVQALLAATHGNVGSGADAGARRGASRGPAPRRCRPCLGAADRRPWCCPRTCRPCSRRSRTSAGGRRARGRAAGAGTAAPRRVALKSERFGSGRCPACRRLRPKHRSPHARVVLRPPRHGTEQASWRQFCISSGCSAMPRPTTSVVLRHAVYCSDATGHRLPGDASSCVVHLAQLLALARLGRDLHAVGLMSARSSTFPQCRVSSSPPSPPARPRRRRDALHPGVGRRPNAALRDHARRAPLLSVTVDVVPDATLPVALELLTPRRGGSSRPRHAVVRIPLAVACLAYVQFPLAGGPSDTGGWAASAAEGRAGQDETPRLRMAPTPISPDCAAISRVIRCSGWRGRLLRAVPDGIRNSSRAAVAAGRSTSSGIRYPRRSALRHGSRG